MNLYSSLFTLLPFPIYSLGTLHCGPSGLVRPVWRYCVSLCLTTNISIWGQSMHVTPCSFSSANTLPQRYQRVPILRLLVWKKPLCNHFFAHVLPLLLPEEQHESSGRQSTNLVVSTIVIACLIDFMTGILGWLTYILLILAGFLVYHESNFRVLYLDSLSGMSESRWWMWFGPQVEVRHFPYRLFSTPFPQITACSFSVMHWKENFST